MSALRQAEEISPELVRSQPVVRQLVADLLAMQNPVRRAFRAVGPRFRSLTMVLIPEVLDYFARVMQEAARR